MDGSAAPRKITAAGKRAGRALSPVLVLTALVVCVRPSGSAADGPPRAASFAQRPVQSAAVAPPARQYAQAQGYIGDAPAQNTAAPAVAEPAPPPQGQGNEKKSPKPREKKVGSVKVHPDDPKDDETISLDFKSVSKALNLDKHEGERSDIREHFRALKGSKVEWSGMVYRVRVGRRGYEIQVKNHSVATDGTYNIVLKGEERDEAKDVDDDDELWFTGEISDYKPGKGERGAIIVLTDGDIRKKKSH